LGDTEAKRVEEIDLLLSEMSSGFGNFDLVLAGAGVFRSYNDPRVIWAGIGYSKQMSRLNKLVTDKLLETGTKLEDRPFRPHLTLGRVKKINDVTKLKMLFDEFKDQEIQRVKVNEIILYESILRPEGPLYRSLGTYPLL
jgi:2'-5' RNA ligase